MEVRCGRTGGASPCWGCWAWASYNALQYLALKTSTPLNVTLVASSTPVFMLGIGALWFGERVTRAQVLGAALSLLGVAVVLSRGDWDLLLHVRLVPGDLLMLLAAAVWAATAGCWCARRPARDPLRLGRLPDGAGGVRAGLVGPLAGG